MSVRIEVQAVGCRYERRLKLGSIVCKTHFSLSLEPLFVNMLVEDRVGLLVVTVACCARSSNIMGAMMIEVEEKIDSSKDVFRATE